MINRSGSFLTKIISDKKLCSKFTIPNLLEYRRVNPDSRAKLVHSELKSRLSNMIFSLENLSYGLGQMPSIKRITDWYIQSYRDLDEYSLKHSIGYNDEYNLVLKQILDRHAPTMMNVSKGIYEWKDDFRERYGGFTDLFSCTNSRNILFELDQELDRFYQDRTSTRLVISHHLSLNKSDEEYTGIVNLNTKPLEVMCQAFEDAKFIAMREYGVVPYLRVNRQPIYNTSEPDEEFLESISNMAFPYIPPHMYHVFFEIFKNSIKGSVDKGLTDDSYINVFMPNRFEDGEYAVRISDYGCGIPKKKIENVWSYFYTTANKNIHRVETLDEIDDFDKSAPIAGFGYGLPVSRMLIRYFGGNICLNSIKGVGVDVNIYF